MNDDLKVKLRAIYSSMVCVENGTLDVIAKAERGRPLTAEELGIIDSTYAYAVEHLRGRSVHVETRRSPELVSRIQSLSVHH